MAAAGLDVSGVDVARQLEHALEAAEAALADVPVAFGLFALGLYFLGRALPIPALWSLFILGWIFQGIGHYHYEKKSPAFFKNLEHILIGPLWIFARLIDFDVKGGAGNPGATSS